MLGLLTPGDLGRKGELVDGLCCSGLGTGVKALLKRDWCVNGKLFRRRSNGRNRELTEQEQNISIASLADVMVVSPQVVPLSEVSASELALPWALIQKRASKSVHQFAVFPFFKEVLKLALASSTSQFRFSNVPYSIVAV